MNSRNIFSFFLIIAASAAGNSMYGQTDASNSPMPGTSAEKPAEDRPKAFNEMVAKRRLEQERKVYEEMLGRGDAALALAEELERSFSKSEALSASDKKKLAELEKLVTKIRKDLGGGDGETPADEPAPATLRHALTFIKTSTENLVEELQRSTRFSISVAAIETSNALIRVMKLLRLKK
jgi:hypothetical protein